MTLTVKDLTYRYAKTAVPVLQGISFTAESGDFLSVLGANGAGKSTLFRCLLGGLTDYTGAIELDGRDVRTLSRRETAEHIAYIPQIHRPTFGYSVLDTTLMGLTRQLSPFRSPTPEMEKHAMDALEEMGVAQLAERNFATLSGGEQQLVLIARALCQRSDILVMDEPTSRWITATSCGCWSGCVSWRSRATRCCCPPTIPSTPCDFPKRCWRSAADRWRRTAAQPMC